MKHRDLVRHLEQNGCKLFRKGGQHTVFVNRTTGKSSTVPRHRKNDYLVKICKDLEISTPPGAILIFEVEL